MDGKKSKFLIVPLTIVSLVSGSFVALVTDVYAAPATHLAFTTEPSGTVTAGATLATQPVVTFQDSTGATDTTVTDTVNLSSFTDATCSTPTTTNLLTGTISQPAVAGVSTFTDVGFSASATDGTYYIGATPTTLVLPTACSSAIALTGGAAQTISNVTISPVGVTVAPGATQQFTATAVDQNGIPLATQPTTFSWTSTDPTVGTVDNTGLFTAVAPGTTNLVVVETVSGTTSQLDPVTVAAAVLTTIAITPVNPTLAIGATQQFTAVALDQNGTPLAVQPTFSWTSTDLAVGTIDATGLFTAIAPGTTAVSALDPVSGITSNVSTVTVTAVPVITSIAVTPVNPTLALGATQQFTAVALDQNGTPLAVQPTFTWASSDPTVGTIDATGLFTAIAAGTTDVTATDPISGISSAADVVTVSATPQVLTSITVTPANPTLAVGSTQQFAAVALDQNSSALATQPAFTWDSSNTTVGTINASGLFTALAAGSTTVSASSGGVTGSTTVTVSTTVVPAVATTEEHEHEENLPTRPTIKKRFEATLTSLTFPVQFERLAHKRVVVTAQVENFATGQTFEKVIKTKLGRDKGRKTITIDGLKHSTTYKIKVKIRKTGSKTKARYSKSHKATTLN